MRLVFDIETNGLFNDATVIHCLCIRDYDTKEEYRFAGSVGITKGLDMLQEADLAIGHNVIGYDIPVINKLYPKFSIDEGKVYDTLVAARLIFSDIKEKDLQLFAAKRYPGHLIGRHSLEAWGYRLNRPKDDYADRMKEKGLDPWSAWNQDMEDYCVQDCRTTEALFDKLQSTPYSNQALKLEHAVAFLISQMERSGFPFDTRKAADLYGILSQKKTELTEEIKTLFPSWYQSCGVFTPKRDNKASGHVAGAELTKVDLVQFNPASRPHICRALGSKYGWKPKVFTDKGAPIVDEEVLKDLPYPEAVKLTELFLVNKRLGQLAEGDQAWLKLERKGRMHGSVNPNGAVSGRATHSNPNVAQVPSVKKPYGTECRSLFGPGVGRIQMGADASGLELRCLSHFMARWDNGAYAALVTEGDVHTANQQAAGLPTRDNAKVFIYALIYGAGDEKIGSIINKGAKAGKKLKDKFFTGIPALGHLRDAVHITVKKRGSLRGLDGRKLHVRSMHSSLNTLLQSAGAIICKYWIVTWNQMMQEAGYTHSVDGDYYLMAWVHDEIQVSCRTQEIADDAGRIAKEAIKAVGINLNFNCPLDGEYKTGSNWAECH